MRTAAASLFRVLPLLGALLLQGCLQPAEERKGGMRYYDLEELLRQQGAQLAKAKAGVRKTITDGRGNVETARLLQTDWPDELSLFRQADINSTAWRNDYRADSSELPAGGHLLRYTRLPDSKATVSWLEVRQNQARQPMQIEAEVSTNNMLFFSRKRLHLRFSPEMRPFLLNTYRVEGKQKLLLADTVTYTMQGIVLR